MNLSIYVSISYIGIYFSILLELLINVFSKVLSYILSLNNFLLLKKSIGHSITIKKNIYMKNDMNCGE